MADGLTLVTIVTAPDGEPGTVAHSRAWRIPTESADEFARLMTERFGEPAQEGLMTIKSAREGAERAAEHGHLFTGDEEPE